MRKGYLSEYFEGVAMKRLSPVEAVGVRSNQHEFNGTRKMTTILGNPDGKKRFETRFLYLSDQNDVVVTDDGTLTWYDARQKGRIERGIDRSEFRLYFTPNIVLNHAAAGDSLVIARRPDNSLLAIVAANGSTIEKQIQWLFGMWDYKGEKFSFRSELETEQDRIMFAAKFILEQIGIDPEIEAPDFLGQMLDKFKESFPESAEF